MPIGGVWFSLTKLLGNFKVVLWSVTISQVSWLVLSNQRVKKLD